MAATEKKLKMGVETDASQSISELERYNKTLEMMARRQDEAAKSARELADAEAARALHERNVNSLEAAAANQEVERTVKKLGDADVKAALEGTAATGKWAVSKNQLKAAAKGASLEIPLIGRAWAFISNPITASIAGIVGAIAIWRMRMRELTATFAETEIASIKVTKRDRVSAVMEEWENFGKLLDGIKEKFNGLESQQDRMLTNLREQTTLAKQLAGDLDPVAAAALGEDLARREAYGESKAGLAFGVSARNKEAEARRLTEELNKGIAGLDPKQREEMLGAIGAERSAAEKDIADREERLKFIDEFAESGSLDLVTRQRFANRYGFGTTAGQAREIETGMLGGARERLAAANAREALITGGGSRAERTRARIGELLTGAAADREREQEYARRAAGTQSSADLAAGVARYQSGQPMQVSNTGAGITVSRENWEKILAALRLVSEYVPRAAEASDRLAQQVAAAEARLKNQR